MVKTYGVKYIGSKDKVIPYIFDSLIFIDIKDKSIIDVFTGTTRVAQAFKSLGFRVITSDLSWASESYANTFISNKSDNKHLRGIVNDLNNIKPEVDWITKNYCDVMANGGVVRVWQPHNGMKADAIRNKIEEINLDRWEKHTLITSLIFALDKVDNTVGVQQAYLKQWCKRSYNNLYLELPKVNEYPEGKHITGNCLDIDYDNAEIAYLDPPYTSHSYATYYHIWDSIARWDKPDVGLRTNRRIDRVSKSEKFDKNMTSRWNKKGEALNALIDLIECLPVRYILLSYNNEGIIEEKNLFSYIEKYENEIISIDYKRNIMSSIGNARKYKDNGFKVRNKEYIIIIRKEK